jgi:hypothetical protein
MFIGNLSGNILIYHDCVTYPYKALKVFNQRISRVDSHSLLCATDD